MENKHVRRISSLFSLGNHSTDKSTRASKSQSSTSLTGLTKDQSTDTSLKIPPSPVLIETPSTGLPSQNGLSPAQSPHFELGRLAPSPEPIVPFPETIVTSSELLVTSPELISTSPRDSFFPPVQGHQTLPDPVGSPTGLVSENKPANRARSKTVSTANSSTDGVDEARHENRSRSPSKFLRTNPLELRSSKRRSWLPGKARSVSHGGETTSPMPQAWILSTHPHDMKPHDISTLINFQPVSWNLVGIFRFLN